MIDSEEAFRGIVIPSSDDFGKRPSGVQSGGAAAGSPFEWLLLSCLMFLGWRRMGLDGMPIKSSRKRFAACG